MEFLDLAFAVKLAATAAVVLLATLIAERAGAFIGAMIAALPISAGPAFLFLAMEHGPAFLAKSALMALALNAAVAPFLLVAALVVRRHGILAAIAAAFPVWLGAAALFLYLDIGLAAALLANVLAYGVCLPLSAPLRAGGAAIRRRRGLFDIALRVAAVVAVIAAALTAGRLLGPTVAGVAAVIPVIWLSMSVVVYARSGGGACSAILANGIPGMIGFVLALTALTVLPPLHGSGLALGSALALCVGWNLGLTVLRAARGRRRLA